MRIIDEDKFENIWANKFLYYKNRFELYLHSVEWAGLKISFQFRPSIFWYWRVLSSYMYSAS